MKGFITSCTYQSKKPGIRQLKSEKTKFYDNSLIMKPHPFLTSLSELYPLVINKLNKTEFFSYYFYLDTVYECPNSKRPKLCAVPQFVQQMDD